MTFEDVLPRLVLACEGGRLVPFIGAGMSRKACTDWPGLISRLEKRAGITADTELTSDTPTAELIRRANTAVRRLRSRGFDEFIDSMVEASNDQGGDIPGQTRALARLWWPLVVSTNYDDYYRQAFAESFSDRQLAVVGRSAEHCQRVLNSLSTAGRALLWAIQGCLRAPEKTPAPNEPDLRRELVVGHDEYRRVTYRVPHFRRAFAEVFRRRSLLFLGSGIRESYLQELFGEVLELHGPGDRPHYALVQKGELDPDFMLARFQILVVEYSKGQHGEVEACLLKLVDAVQDAGKPQVSWSWGRIEHEREDRWHSVPELEVVRGGLPDSRPSDGECLAVSAGGGERFFFSKGIAEVMSGWGVKPTDQPVPLSSRFLGVYPASHVYAVRARSAKDERALSFVHDAALALFAEAGPRYRCIRMQLLACGGAEKMADNEGSPWQQRPFPERFSFIQIVRAYGEWRRKHPRSECRLVLHVVDELVAMEIAAGRIDVVELLGCVDVRFWVEVVGDQGEIERRLFQRLQDCRLDTIVADMNLPESGWSLEVSPYPSLEDLRQPRRPVAERLGKSLLELGVVPGSTLHFRRLEAAAAPQGS